MLILMLANLACLGKPAASTWRPESLGDILVFLPLQGAGSPQSYGRLREKIGGVWSPLDHCLANLE